MCHVGVSWHFSGMPKSLQTLFLPVVTISCDAVGYKKVPAALCSVLRNSLHNIKSTLFPQAREEPSAFPRCGTQSSLTPDNKMKKLFDLSRPHRPKNIRNLLPCGKNISSRSHPSHAPSLAHDRQPLRPSAHPPAGILPASSAIFRAPQKKTRFLRVQILKAECERRL